MCNKIEIELNLSSHSAQRTKLSVVYLSDIFILSFSTKTIVIQVQSDAILSDHDLLFKSDHSVEEINMFTHIVNCSMTVTVLKRSDL